MRRLLLPTALVLLLPAACKDDGDTGDSANVGTTGDPATTTTAADDDGGSADDGSGGSDTGPAVDPNAPTFYGDVLPIIIEECSQCHVDGGIAPFALEDYQMAKDLSGAIQVITENRIMPPFNANNDGSCNTFSNARWLSDEQLETIAAWVEGGAQEGDPSTQQPPLPEPTILQGSDIEDRAMPSNYVPIADGTGSDGYDDYQCFLVDLEIADAPRYLVGFEVLPGNAATTHHLIGFLVNPESPSAVFGTNGDLMT